MELETLKMVFKKYILTPIIYFLVFFYVVLEEFIWNKIFKSLYIKIKAFDLLNRFKKYIEAQTNRYYILFIFLIPFLLMEVVSTLGLILIAKGLVVIGSILYGAKILITVPVVIIFNSTKKKLLSFYIMKVSYFWLLQVKRNKTFRTIKRKIKALKNFFIRNEIKASFN